MSSELVPVNQNEVAIFPVDSESGLVLAVGQDLGGHGTPVPRLLLNAALDKAGLFGGAVAAKNLLDGSLVAIDPETLRQIKQGAVFLKDKQGSVLPMLRTPGQAGVKRVARILPGAANPVAAGLLLQTMAVQRSLGQIQDALNLVNTKLDLLIEGMHYEVLADITAYGSQLAKLRDKAALGNDLTAVDEVKIRDYEDKALSHVQEASLWLGHLRELIQAESLSLRAHHERLEQLLDKHVAFWVRTYVASNLCLAQARTLRLYRASTAEPEAWVRQLQQTVQADISRIGGDLAGLAVDLDAYLRRHDIASGLAELSFGKKRTVRRLRRELWRTQETLRVTISDVLPALPIAAGDAPVELPERLRRREIEPHPVRDAVGHAWDEAARGTKQAGAFAGDQALRTIDRVARKIEERRSESGPDGGDV